MKDKRAKSIDSPHPLKIYTIIKEKNIKFLWGEAAGKIKIKFSISDLLIMVNI